MYDYHHKNNVHNYSENHRHYNPIATAETATIMTTISYAILTIVIIPATTLPTRRQRHGVPEP